MICVGLHHALQAERLFNQEHHAQRRRHQQRRQRGDRRIEMILDIAHDFDRQHAHARAREERGQRHVVERVDHGHDARRRDAGLDIGNHDMEERIDLCRAQRARSLLNGKIEVCQARGHHTHHIRDRQQRMADQQAGDDLQIILIDNVAQHDEAQNDARDEHRGEEQRLDHFLALEAEAVERIRRRQTQQQRDARRRNGDDHAQLGRLDEGAHRQHLLVPVEGEALARELECLRLREGRCSDDQQRTDQKDIHQEGDEHQRPVFLLHSTTAPNTRVTGLRMGDAVPPYPQAGTLSLHPSSLRNAQRR